MRFKRKNRMRKATRYALITISSILIIFSFSSLINNIQRKDQNIITKEVYRYTDKFNYDYKINLIDNKFMNDTDVMDKKLAYVTDLIDNIDLYLNYEYAGTEKSNLKCAYSIVGRMQAVYSKSGEEQKIWDKEEILLAEQSKEASSDKLQVNEHLVLDLKDKNELLNDFKQQLGMAISAKFTISLKMQVSTNIDDQDIVDNYVPILNVDLAEKTTKISGDNNIQKTEYISKEIKVTEGQRIGLIIFDSILLVASIILLRYALMASVIVSVRNEFKYELNRILRICQDKIVEVSTRPNDEKREIVFVKDFGEIFKISEELFKPILYYKKSEEDEAWFTVVSEKTSYRYILKK